MATRHERVVLTLQDDFSTAAARAAAATALLNRNLHDVDGTAASTGPRLVRTSADVDRLGSSTRRAGADIDQFSGRLRLMGEAALTLGPALVPLGGLATTAVVGLATQLGAAAGAAGVAALAFNSVGEALESVREYELEPTAENLAEMNRALEGLGEAGADFVMFLSSVRPQLQNLQAIAREGLLPGVQEGITSLLEMGPQVERIVANIAGAMGELAARSGEALSGERFSDFFDYIETSAIPLLTDMGRTFGFVVEGLANLMVAFDPVSRDFSRGLLGMAESFAQWSRGLESNTGFQSFVNYLRETGPQAVEALGAIINAIAALVEAAAPLGQAVLPILTEVAHAFADIARSPVGPSLLTAAAGFVALNRALTAGSALYASTAIALGRVGTKADGLGLSLGSVGRSAGVLAAVASAGAGLGALVADLTGANLQLEDLAENLNAIAAGDYDNGALENMVDDLRIVSDRGIIDGAKELGVEVFSLNGAFGLFSTTLDGAQDDIKAVDAQLAAMVASGQGDEAARIFEAIVAQMNGLAAGSSVSDQALEDAMQHYGGYKAAVEAAGDATEATTEATKRSSTALSANTTSLQENLDAMKARRQEALSAFDAETRWREALVSAREQADKNSAGIRGNSEAARSNRDAISALAQAWNNQSDAVKNNESRFRAARAAMIDAAQGMGLSEEAARKLTNRLLEIPKEVVSRARFEDAQAQDRILALRRSLSSIPDETVYVNVQRRNIGGPAASNGFATGGLVRGPGTATSDSIPARLSDGEFVVNAYATARHRSLLEQINAHQYADGGYVTNVDQRRYDQRVMVPAGQSAMSVTASVELTPLREEIRALRAAVMAADVNNQQAVMAGARQFGREVRNEAQKGARGRL